MAEEPRCWRIGDVIYDTVSFRLWKPDKGEPSRPLGPKEAELLYFFISNYPKRLTFKTPQQVMRKAWGEVLGDDLLYKTTQALRDALGDSKKEIIVAQPHRLEVEPIAVPCPSIEILKSKHLPSRAQDLYSTGNEIRLSGNDGASDASSLKESDLVRTTAGMFDRKILFSYDGGYAEAIRLFGSGDEFVVATQKERFDVKYAHSLYTIPPELQDGAQQRIARLEEEARSTNKRFFNGPAVRLMRWNHNQESPTEAHNLKLELGAVGWYDLEGTNNLIREEGRQREAYARYIDLPKIESGDFEAGCKLSNLTGNAVTIFTADGKVGFQKRGIFQSAVPGQITSAVAENVNRYKDDTDPESPSVLLKPQVGSSFARDPNYTPRGVPHPLAAVRRGLAAEISPDILEHVDQGILVTGLALGLDSLHADLLWIVLVNATAEKCLELLRDREGSEVDEGELDFVTPRFDNPITKELLKRSDWVAAGKASLIRAIKLIKLFSPGGDPREAFHTLNTAS